MRIKSRAGRSTALDAGGLVVLAMGLLSLAAGVAGYVPSSSGTGGGGSTTSQTGTGTTTTTATVTSSSASTSITITATTTVSNSQSTTVVGSTTVTKSTTSSTQPSGIVVGYVYPAVFSGCGQLGPDITVYQGCQVSVSVTLTSSALVSGTVDIQVRRDMGNWPDDTHTDLASTVTLIAGTSTISAGPFTASDLSGGGTGCAINIGCFRGYFIKVLWNGNPVYDPTTRGTRETVETTACVGQSFCSGGGGSTATTTTSTSASVGGGGSTTTTQTLPATTLAVSAVDQAGNQLAAQVTLDGRNIGSTPVSSVALPVGPHAVACSAVSGYSSLDTSFAPFSDGRTPVSLQCLYAVVQTGQSPHPTATLTVVVQVYSVSLRIYYPDNEAPVVATGGGITQTQYTSSPNGQAQFILPSGQTYAITVNDPAFGSQSTSAALPASGTTVTVTYATGGLSALAGLYAVLTPLELVVVGIILLAGGLGMVYLGEKR